jgi:hypothetical protein
MSKPNLTHVEARLHQQTVRCYQVASRRLQKQLGVEAPSTEELLARQLSGRSARTVAGDYLSRHPRR